MTQVPDHALGQEPHEVLVGLLLKPVQIFLAVSNREIYLLPLGLSCEDYLYIVRKTKQNKNQMRAILTAYLPQYHNPNPQTSLSLTGT